MITINVLSGTTKRIVCSLDGTSYNVKFNEEIYNSLISLQKELEDIETMEEYEMWKDKALNILTGVKEKDEIETACPDLVKSEKTGNYFIKVSGKVSKHPVPQPLVDKILESVDKGIDPTPIVKAWIRFLRNPNLSTSKAEYFANYITTEVIDIDEMNKLQEEEGYSYEKAANSATYNDVMITQEGLIVAKKYARLLTKGWVIDPETNQPILKDLYDKKVSVDQWSGEVTEEIQYPEYNEEFTFEPPIMGRSGDAFYCGDVKDHIIKVGQEIKLESWNQVNTTDDHFGCKGLHVGGIRYVSSYKAFNNQLLECFVDPAEIGAFVEGDDFAMRVKSYFVYGATLGKNKGLYHSSKYAAMKDAEWEAYKKEAVENSNKLFKEATDFDIN